MTLDQQERRDNRVKLGRQGQPGSRAHPVHRDSQEPLARLAQWGALANQASQVQQALRVSKVHRVSQGLLEIRVPQEVPGRRDSLELLAPLA